MFAGSDDLRSLVLRKTDLLKEVACSVPGGVYP